jgi:hypothetical protein
LLEKKPDMKKLLWIPTLLFFAAAGAQTQSGWGLRAGIQYPQNGDLKTSIASVEQDLSSGADQRSGWHIGASRMIYLGGFYLKPELVFAQTSSNYQTQGLAADLSDEFKLTQQHIELPVLVGFSVLGPVHLSAGPQFRYLLQEQVSGIKDLNVDQVGDQWTLGLQWGVGFHTNRWAIEVRMDRGLNAQESAIVQRNTPQWSSRIDQRKSQWLLGVTYQLSRD